MGAQGYVCPQCLRWFPEQAKLREHHEKYHQGEIVPKPV